MERTLHTLDDLSEEAQALAARLSPKETGATLLTLSGELGAGKTSFTQALARAYGIEEPVTSPTFVLEKIYQLPPGQSFTRLAHIDAYRLMGGAELGPLGFAELMNDPATLVVLEWPEMVMEGLPRADVAIQLAVLPDESRTITYG